MQIRDKQRIMLHKRGQRDRSAADSITDIDTHNYYACVHADSIKEPHSYLLQTSTILLLGIVVHKCSVHILFQFDELTVVLAPNCTCAALATEYEWIY